MKKVGFERLSIFRPGFLFGRNDRSRMGEYLIGAVCPSAFGVSIETVGRAIVKNALKLEGKGVEVFMNSDIKRIADE